ncbi:MAG: hypothetical protein AAFN11_14370 [Chloroflexota bacterium]
MTENRKGNFTPEQNALTPGKSSGILGCWSISIIILAILVVGWFGYGRFVIDRIPYILQICWGTGIAVVIIAFVATVSMLFSSITSQPSTMQGKLSNVYATYNGTVFNIDSKKFEIAKKDVYRQLRDFEDLQVAVYYLEKSGLPLAVSMEVVDVPQGSNVENLTNNDAENDAPPTLQADGA